jgi:exosortase family protein XrtF
MKVKLPSGTFVRFIIRAGLLYLFLYVIYQFGIRQYTTYDQKFIAFLVRSSEFFLNAFGYRTFDFHESGEDQVIGIDGTTGLWVGSGCNAITLFALFSVFIICYPGNRKHKLWFIPLGILCIHFLNIARIVALVIIAYRTPAFLEFNHTYTFTFIIYAFIFGLWMFWVNRFAALPTDSDAKK